MIHDPAFKVLDFRECLNFRSRKRFVAELLEAFTDQGFVGLTHSGVDRSLLSAVYAESHSVFRLPSDTKAKYEARSARGIRGFAIFAPPGATREHAEWKECWNFGPTQGEHGDLPDNLWPTEAPALRQSVDQLYESLNFASQQLLGACAEALQLPTPTFSEMSAGANSILRLMYYPSRQAADSESAIRVRDHEDLSMLTLLCPPTADGLEFLGSAGNRIPVAGGGDALIVNVGQMMSHLSGKRFRSALHRVVAGKQAVEERMSIPFFVQARPEADFTVGTEPRQTAGDFFMLKVRELEGYRPN